MNKSPLPHMPSKTAKPLDLNCLLHERLCVSLHFWSSVLSPLTPLIMCSKGAGIQNSTFRSLSFKQVILSDHMFKATYVVLIEGYISRPDCRMHESKMTYLYVLFTDERDKAGKGPRQMTKGFTWMIYLFFTHFSQIPDLDKELEQLQWLWCYRWIIPVDLYWSFH